MIEFCTRGWKCQTIRLIKKVNFEKVYLHHDDDSFTGVIPAMLFGCWLHQ